MLTDSVTKESKGIGLVLYTNEVEALNAIKAMHGKTILDSKATSIDENFTFNSSLVVRLADSPSEKKRLLPNIQKSDSKSVQRELIDSYHPNDRENSNIFVFHLPPHYNDDAVRSLFEVFGPIESVRVIVNASNRQSAGYGFVKFTNHQDAARAIQQLNGKPIEYFIFTLFIYIVASA